MHSGWKSREGGSLWLWPFSLEGLLGLSKNVGGPPFCVLLHFYATIFETLPPPPPPVGSYTNDTLWKLIFILQNIFFCVFQENEMKFV